jgi:hypothetical protein
MMQKPICSRRSIHCESIYINIGVLITTEKRPFFIFAGEDFEFIVCLGKYTKNRILKWPPYPLKGISRDFV